MSEEHTLSFNLEVDVERTYREAQRLLTVFNRAVSLARRLGLPEDIDQGIAKMQRAIAITNQLRLTMIALQAASGPIGWALALIGLGATALDVGNFVMDLGGYS